MELSDIQLFIKNNCKIVSLNIDYTNEGDIHNYVINIQGINHKLKLIEEGEDVIKLIYNDNTFTDENEIQLELFELFNYKNIEYIDCYIIKKRNIDNFEILDIYDDYYDNNDDILICNRSFKKNDKLIKIKIIYQNEEYTMYYNLETIHGFDNIIEKIDLIL
jgi:alpha-N-acetylglucosamine transferase